MQAPLKEIGSVFSLISSAPTPDVQKVAINRFYTSDAGLHHPLFSVKPAPLSRESILGVYQWLRVICSNVETDVENTVFDKKNGIAYVEVTQRYHFRISPFKPVRCRFLSRMKLREENGKYLICLQEDYFQPDELTSLLVPPLAPVVRFMLYAGTITSNILAKSAQVIGFWRAPAGIDYDSNDNARSTGTSASTSGGETQKLVHVRPHNKGSEVRNGEHLDSRTTADNSNVSLRRRNELHGNEPERKNQRPQSDAPPYNTHATDHTQSVN